MPATQTENGEVADAPRAPEPAEGRGRGAQGWPGWCMVGLGGAEKRERRSTQLSAHRIFLRLNDMIEVCL